MSLHSAHKPVANDAVLYLPDTIIEHVDVWSASIADKTGGLSWLLKGMDEAGADFNFIIARRTPENPGSGVVFVPYYILLINLSQMMLFCIYLTQLSNM